MKKTLLPFVFAIALWPGLAGAAEETFSVYKVGDLKIVRLVDSSFMMPAELLIGDAAEIRRLLPEGSGAAAIAAYVLDAGTDLVLLDAGFGELGDGGAALANLAKAGYSPDSVTKVILTHMHGDHVGGTIKNGQAAFPKAEIFVAEAELAFWSDRGNIAKAPPMLANTFDLAAEFARIYGNRVKTFREGETVVDWLKPIAVPGHTAGHTMFELTWGGERRYIWGDIMHCLAAQAANPDISVAFDTDPAEAAQSRKKALEMVEGIPVFGVHLPHPGVATFSKGEGKGYSYKFILPE